MMTGLIVFGFGLIIGSFLNAIIHRLWTGESIATERSMCPHCKHTLTALDLVPVLSFVFLQGRCRYCRKKISWQYPVIELLTAISFVLLAQNLSAGGGSAFGGQLSFNFQFWFQLVFICFLIVIAVFDLKHYLILDRMVFPASAIALVYTGFLSYQMGNFGFHSPVGQGLLGAVMVSGFFAAQYFISAGRWIGFGDVKLGIFLGLLFGFGQSLVVLFLSYCLGAVVGLGLIALGHKQLGSRMPFGTFLASCAIIMLLYGKSILDWYLKLVGF